MYYPLFIDLKNEPVLIIGGGEIAYRKGKELVRAGAKVTLLAPERVEDWRDLGVIWKDIPYEEQDLSPYTLVVVATDDVFVNDSVVAQCKAKKIHCNAAYSVKAGDIVMPGIIEEGGFSITISSQGRTPFLTKKIKEDIKALLANYSEETIALLGKTREHILKTYPDEKEVLLKKLAEMPIKEIEEKGNIHDITDWLKRE